MIDPLDEAVAHIMDSDPAIRQADTWGRITAAFIRPLLRTVGVTRPMAEGFTHVYLQWQFSLAENDDEDDDSDDSE